MDNVVRAHILIEGRVQGVGYRAFAYEKAIHEGLSGWVQNLPDGRVELEVEGPRQSIGIMLSSLKLGPSAAKVQQVHVEWLEAIQETHEFRIVHRW